MKVCAECQKPIIRRPYCWMGKWHHVACYLQLPQAGRKPDALRRPAPIRLHLQEQNGYRQGASLRSVADAALASRLGHGLDRQPLPTTSRSALALSAVTWVCALSRCRFRAGEAEFHAGPGPTRGTFVTLLTHATSPTASLTIRGNAPSAEGRASVDLHARLLNSGS